MNKFTLLLSSIVLYYFYQTLNEIESEGAKITKTLLIEKNEAWEKHSNLPEQCSTCHLNYFNRLDKPMKKFSNWQQLNDYVGCKNNYKNRVEQGNKMPCLKVNALINKLVYKLMKE